ncbi:DMT family transporter [Sulfobacillus thermosulfidooxidans]|uniref:DMT family transporter n=1 Tax=Sulfobacillus thermosulfidooxidans TaxID=28034 RepID=UPI0006B599F5|nr:DMT family transporter [Sulfobacillus thermosulfidooxidans]
METFLALLYTFLWSSASVATKFGLKSGPPLMLAAIRFSLAGLILLAVNGLLHRGVWPKREQMGALAMIGFLNTTLYLGASFMALQVVPAGLFNLFVAVNPFFVLILEFTWLKKTIRRTQWWGFIVAVLGLGIGSWQALTHVHTPLWGLILVIGGQMAMALGSIYFHHVGIPGSTIIINIWQLIWGAIFLWPIALLVSFSKPIKWNGDWWGSLLWLVGAVSIGAMLLWFRLLRQGAAKASMWLLLTPIIGYVLGFLILHEALTFYDMIASILVMFGLFLANRRVLSQHGGLNTSSRTSSDT